MKSLFDTLNIVYAEQEKRGFIKLNAISLAFTAGAVVFILIAIAAVGVLPIALKFIGLPDVTGPLAAYRKMAGASDHPGLCPRAHLPLWPEPESATLALDFVGQCSSRLAVARGIGVIFVLRRQLWQF
jgi:hypothetical protein